MEPSVQTETFSRFTLRDTQICKGVAVLLLLVHHALGSGKTELYRWAMTYNDKPVIYLVAISAKVCVTIFLLLSGYGMAKSMMKKVSTGGGQWLTGKPLCRAAGRHLGRVYANYWLVYLLFVPVGALVFGRTLAALYPDGLVPAMLWDVLGLARLFGTATANATWWYMTELVFTTLMFPLCYLLACKWPVATLGLSYLCTFVFHQSISGPALARWLFPFVAGICLARWDALDKLSSLCEGERSKRADVLVGSALLVAAFTCLRIVTGASIDVDVPYALAILLVSRALPRGRLLAPALEFLGRHSMNIFLTHTFYLRWLKNLVYASGNAWLSVLTLLVLAVATSVVLDLVKRGIEKLVGLAARRKVTIF